MPVPLLHPDVCFSQSSLLKYREFEPPEYPECSPAQEPRAVPNPIPSQGRTRPSRWWPFRSPSRSRVDLREPSQSEALRAREKPPTRHVKKMPVLFLDEAHKLYVFHSFRRTPLIVTFSPGLIQSVEAMKALLDSMLVLTKQDRLCHVIHATSDPFYQTWLRQLNVMQHCKVHTAL